MTRIASHRFRNIVLAALVAFAFVATTAATSYGRPPAHAPAHGWRKKNDPTYYGYDGRRWPNDYGIQNGYCNRSAIGAAVGGSVGGAIGAAVAKGDNRFIAIVLGSAVGAAVGSEIGRRIDQSDLGCFGHSLELGDVGQTIRWKNPNSGINFALTPIRDFERGGRVCRVFETTTTNGETRSTVRGEACRNSNGEWGVL